MRIFKFGKKNQETKKNFRRLIKKSSCSRHVAQKGARLSAKIDVIVKLGTLIGVAHHVVYAGISGSFIPDGTNLRLTRTSRSPDSADFHP